MSLNDSMVEVSNGKNSVLSGFYITELRLLNKLCTDQLECLWYSHAVHSGHLFSLAGSEPVVKYSERHPQQIGIITMVGNTDQDSYNQK